MMEQQRQQQQERQLQQCDIVIKVDLTEEESEDEEEDRGGTSSAEPLMLDPAVRHCAQCVSPPFADQAELVSHMWREHGVKARVMIAAGSLAMERAGSHHGHFQHQHRVKVEGVVERDAPSSPACVRPVKRARTSGTCAVPSTTAVAAPAAAAAAPVAAPAAAPAAANPQPHSQSIPGLKGIRRITNGGWYEVRICYGGKQHLLAQGVKELRVAVETYNRKAKKLGKPLNVYQPEQHGRDVDASAVAAAQVATAAASDHHRRNRKTTSLNMTGIGRMDHGRYFVRICHQGTQRVLGYTKTLREAVEMYNRKATELGKTLNVYRGLASERAPAPAPSADAPPVNHHDDVVAPPAPSSLLHRAGSSGGAVAARGASISPTIVKKRAAAAPPVRHGTQHRRDESDKEEFKTPARVDAAVAPPAAATRGGDGGRGAGMIVGAGFRGVGDGSGATKKAAEIPPPACPGPLSFATTRPSADTSSRDTRSDAMFNARVATIMDLRQRGVINQETFDEGMKNLVKALTSSPLL